MMVSCNDIAISIFLDSPRSYFQMLAYIIFYNSNSPNQI